MRRLAVALVLAALVVVASGCGEKAPLQPFGVPAESPAPQASATQSPSEEELLGPHVDLPGGLQLKQLGKVVQWGGPKDDDPNTWNVRLVLDKVEIDPTCEKYTRPADRGHRLVLAIRVETNAKYDQMVDGIPQYFEWSTIGLDGVTEAPPTSSQACRNGEGFPSQLRPSAKYRGEVTVDTSNAAGQLVLGRTAAWNYGTTA